MRHVIIGLILAYAITPWTAKPVASNLDEAIGITSVSNSDAADAVCLGIVCTEETDTCCDESK
jgi:hypothetical protein